MKKLALTGANGLIGSRLVELLSPNYEIVGISHTEMDITDRDSVHSYLATQEFDTFIHLAAYTNVDGAEVEHEKAMLINVDGTRNVFEAVQNMGKQFVLFSTDFVFDGDNPPYNEASVPNPISSYGSTKHMAEQVVEEQALIVRIAYPYRAQFEPKKDFLRTIKYILEQGKPLTMVEDSIMTPTFVDDIAFALDALIQDFAARTVHVVGNSSISPYESGKLIAKTFGLDETLITPTTYAAFFNGKAQRPRYSQMETTNNQYPMKSYEEGLAAVLEQLKIE